MSKYKLLLPVFFIISFFITKDSICAAWTQAKGEGQFILNASSYKSYKLYNQDSEVQKSEVKFKKLR